MASRDTPRGVNPVLRGVCANLLRKRGKAVLSYSTNMHELTVDFYTVGQILGHSLKGIGIHLNMSNNLKSVTAQYVDARLNRKAFVLDTYHTAILNPAR